MTEIFETRVSVNKTGTNNKTIVLNADSGDLTLGGHGSDGDVILKDANRRTRIHLDPGNNNLKISDGDGNSIVELGRNGNLRLGGGNSDGDLALRDANGVNRINFDAQNHEMVIKDSANKRIGSFGRNANLRLGSNGHDGDILLYPSSASDHDDRKATIHLDGNAGDIILRNADAAEDFDVSGSDVMPGSVLVIDDDGKLSVSRKSYDTRVAGVVSGDGNYRPAIILDRQTDVAGRLPVALAGKVFVKADASDGPISVGDLMTSSNIPGHAMRVVDRSQAFGAVIGKALAPLATGCGHIPILVSLQ